MVRWIVKDVYGVEMVFTVRDILLKSVNHVETARQKDEYNRNLVLLVEIAYVEEGLYHRKSCYVAIRVVLYITGCNDIMFFHSCQIH